MADLQKTVAIVFQGKDEFSGALNSINTSLKGFGQGISDFTKPFADLGESIVKVEAALTAMIAGALTLAVAKAGEFEEAFGAVQLRLQGTGADVGKFENDVLAYAQGSTKSFQEINKAISEAISKGIDYKVVLSYLADAEKLSLAGRGDLSSATVLLTTVMNAYGASADQAAKYSDVFVAAIQQGAGTLPDMAESLGAVAGIAAAAGVPIETLTAAIAALGASGVPVDAAISGLKMTISNLLDPGTEARQMAAKLGLEFDATALKTRGLEAVLKDAYKATKGNAEAMKTLFGSVRGLNVAMNLAADSNGKFKDTLEAVRNSAGTTTKAFIEEQKELGNLTQNIKNNIDVLMISIGQKLLPSVGEMGRSLAEVFKSIKFGLDSGAFAPLFEALTRFGDEMAEKLRAIAANLPEALKGLDFSGLIASFESLGGNVGKAFASIFGDIDLSTVEGLHIFLQKLVDGFAALTNVTSGIVQGLEPFFRLIGGAVTEFSSLSSGTAELVGNFLGLTMAVNNLAGIFSAFMTMLSLKGIASLASLAMAAGTAAPAIYGMVTAMSAAQLGFLALAAVIGAGIGTWLNQFEVVGKTAQAILYLADIQGNYFGALTKTKGELAEIDRQYEQAVARQKDVAAAQDKTTDSIAKTGTVAKQTQLELTGLFEQLKEIGKAAVDPKTIKVVAELDMETVEIITEELDKVVPGEKKVDVGLDVTKIKEQAAIIQKSMEWTAKVDIAQVEAAVKTLQTMLSSVDTGIKSTGDLIGSLFGQMEKAGSWTKDMIRDQIKLENERREQEFDSQKELIAQQIKMNDLKIRNMQDGKDSLIKVEMSGIEPHVEAIMWKILETVQIRANSVAAEFLLGWSD